MPADFPPAEYRFLLKTRAYGPKSRRTVRRLMICAKIHGLDVRLEHDRGWLFRLNLITLTGPSSAIKAYIKRVNHLLPFVAHRRWNR
ncbi:hypothetical protein [Nonomuraea dietziae]|uniref:hypothetical protein n=1 Tax=Nonomuraea dietziae TaxID=65515 RepID=UPI00340ABA09